MPLSYFFKVAGSQNFEVAILRVTLIKKVVVILGFVNLGYPEDLLRQVSTLDSPLKVTILHLPTVPVPFVDLGVLQVQQIS